MHNLAEICLFLRSNQKMKMIWKNDITQHCVWMQDFDVFHYLNKKLNKFWICKYWETVFNLLGDKHNLTGIVVAMNVHLHIILRIFLVISCGLRDPRDRTFRLWILCSKWMRHRSDEIGL